MTSIRSTFLASTIALLLCSCNPGTTVSTDNGNVVAKGDRITLRADGHPNAQIDESGNLLIDGKKVQVNARQRALLQDYKREFNGMTEDGLAIGKQGAALAGTAITEAIKGAIRGDGEQVDAKIEAEAKKIEQQAMRLCTRLVTIKASQDALAAQLPPFKPYATIEGSDVDDCGTSQSDSYAAGKEVGGSLARAVKGGSKEPADGGDAAAQADAAADSAAESEASTR